MPKLLQITVDGNAGSTGRIAESIGVIAIKSGWKSYIAHAINPRISSSNIIRIGNKFDLILKKITEYPATLWHQVYQIWVNWSHSVGINKLPASVGRPKVLT